MQRAYRKHVPCFYRVTEIRVGVWENEKCCGNTSRRRVFSQLFRALPNFQEGSIILCKHGEHVFYFLSFIKHGNENKKKKQKQILYFDHRLKCKFSFLALSLRQQLVLVFCFHRAIETRFLTSRRAYNLSAVF